MTVRPIHSIGDPILRQVSTNVLIDRIQTSDVVQMIDDLVDTMRDANGAGLAANQIGYTQRIVVMEVDHNPRYPYKPQIPLTVAINPIIEPLDDEMVIINEGCLSVPLRGDVERHVNVRVRFHDREGKEYDEIKRGLTAGTWQHECDHLDGVLITDRADPATLATWAEFQEHQRDAFVERITEFVDRVGS